MSGELRASIFDKIQRGTFLKVLAAFYFLGFLLHGLDVLDLRQKFSEMSGLFQAWSIYLLIFDLLTAVCLLRYSKVGTLLFHIVALTQLCAYIFFQEVFGRQDALVIFHIVAITIYWKIIAREKTRYYYEVKHKA